jgi:hypothetical protein
MALTIVLIIFIVVFGTMGVLMYLWWRKYGKNLFDMILKLQNLQNMGSNSPKLPNMGDIQQQMKAFNDIMKKMGKK